MIDLDIMPLRQLQLESARALTCIATTSRNINQFNKLAAHDSLLWYKAVINWYVDQYNGLPSQVGPGSTVKLLMDFDV
jgi:hypothetical protein